MNAKLTTNLSDPLARPYFLWDEPLTVARFRQRLASPAHARWLGKLLREARDTDVWQLTTPEEVWREWPEIERYQGRRRGFWEFLLGRWREEGLTGNNSQFEQNRYQANTK
jgi:hypothetical protein